VQLYSFNRRELDLAVSWVALSRSLVRTAKLATDLTRQAVSAGTIWAFVVMQIYPYMARHEMRYIFAECVRRAPDRTDAADF